MNKQTLTIIIAATIGSSVAGAVIPRLIFGSKDEQLNGELIKSCNDINKNCPITIDSYTRLDNSMAGNKSISYFYTLTNIEDDKAIGLKEKIKSSSEATLKSKQETIKMLENGIEMKYFYKNSAGKILFDYTVTK